MHCKWGLGSYTGMHVARGPAGEAAADLTMQLLSSQLNSNEQT